MTPHDAGELAGFLLPDPSLADALASARYADPSDVRAFRLAFLLGAARALWCERKAR